MEKRSKYLLILLALILTLAPVSEAVAGLSKEDPVDGPMGVAYQSDAQGIKLAGFMSLEYYDFDYVTVPGEGQKQIARARVGMTLRKGNTAQTFFTDVDGSELDPSGLLPFGFVYSQNSDFIQSAITASLEVQILQYFFGEYDDMAVPAQDPEDWTTWSYPGDLNITLKYFEEYPAVEATSFLAGGSILVAAELVAAIK